jgi:dienelactone hydrolase
MAIKTQPLLYKHNNVTMAGFLAFDEAKTGTKRPGVLVCHEWWGLNDYIRGRAVQLAEMGYVAFAPDMFGEGVTVTDHTEAAKLMTALTTNPDAGGRLAAAFNLLSSRPECDSTKLASIGYCMGGSMSLYMARMGLPLRAVAAFHGNLQNKSPEKRKEIKAKVLVCVGADDPMIPPADVEAFEKEMRQANADYQIVIYGGARHAFTNPNADKAGLPPLKYDAKADRRSWTALKDFLGEVFT